MEAAVRPSQRTSSQVREHEVIRVSGTINNTESIAAVQDARREILAWVQNRCGGKLPSEAWACDSFEFFAGGRNSLGARLQTEAIDIWGVRAEDPDKEIAGRVWTTEVSISCEIGRDARFGLRQIVNTAEPELDIQPHVPGLVRQLIDRFGVSCGQDSFESTPWNISADSEAEYLADKLLDPYRQIPFIVLSGDERDRKSDRPRLDPSALSRSLCGIAHIVVVPAEQTRVLTRRLGGPLSVFHGGVRYYHPGLTLSGDRFRHRLFLGDTLIERAEQRRAIRWLCGIAASDSLRRNRLGRDVIAFRDIRNATLMARQDRLASEGASEAEQLSAAKSTIKSLERTLSEERQALAYFDEEAQKEKERAEAAESQLRSATAFIETLQSRLQERGEDIDDSITSPETWGSFNEWVDRNFAGRISLAAAARRNCKDAAFADLELVARCFQWLASDYRQGRMKGAEGDFRDFVIESGIRNSFCGSDEFETDWQGQRHLVDWHIKNGGNTRSPERCLRIYYFWEPETRQVVVADLPAHRRTGAS